VDELIKKGQDLMDKIILNEQMAKWDRYYPGLEVKKNEYTENPHPLFDWMQRLIHDFQHYNSKERFHTYMHIYFNVDSSFTSLDNYEGQQLRMLFREQFASADFSKVPSGPDKDALFSYFFQPHVVAFEDRLNALLLSPTLTYQWITKEEEEVAWAKIKHAFLALLDLFYFDKETVDDQTEMKISAVYAAFFEMVDSPYVSKFWLKMMKKTFLEKLVKDLAITLEELQILLKETIPERIKKHFIFTPRFRYAEIEQFCYLFSKEDLQILIQSFVEVNEKRLVDIEESINNKENNAKSNLTSWLEEMETLKKWTS
jgi:hypothetical protein